MIVISKNTQATTFGEVVLLNSDRQIIKRLVLASDNSLLLPEDFIEYGANFVPEKYKVNSDFKMRYLNKVTKESILDNSDLIKLSKVLLPTNALQSSEESNIDYFGSIKLNDNIIYAIFIESSSDPSKQVRYVDINSAPSSSTVAEIVIGYEDKETEDNIVEGEFNNDAVIWVTVNTSKKNSDINLSYLVLQNSENPLRNLNQTYLRNDELFNLSTQTNAIDNVPGTDIKFDSLSGTLLSNKTYTNNRILKEMLSPDQYCTFPYSSNISVFRNGDIAKYLDKGNYQYIQCNVPSCINVVKLFSKSTEDNTSVKDIFYATPFPNAAEWTIISNPSEEQINSAIEYSLGLYDHIGSRDYEVGDIVIYNEELFECTYIEENSYLREFEVLSESSVGDLYYAAPNPSEDTTGKWQIIANISRGISEEDYLDLNESGKFITYQPNTVVKYKGTYYKSTTVVSNAIKYTKKTDLNVGTVNDRKVYRFINPALDTLHWKKIELDTINNFTILPDTYKNVTVGDITTMKEYRRGEIVLYKNRVYKSLVNHNYNFDIRYAEKVIDVEENPTDYKDALDTTDIYKIYTGNCTSTDPSKLLTNPIKSSNTWELLNKAVVFPFDSQFAYNQGDLAYWDGEIWVSLCDNIGETNPIVSNNWAHSFNSVNYLGNIIRVILDESKAVFSDSNTSNYSFLGSDYYDVYLPAISVNPGYKLENITTATGNMLTRKISYDKFISPLRLKNVIENDLNSLSVADRKNINSVIVGTDFNGYIIDLCTSAGEFSQKYSRGYGPRPPLGISYYITLVDSTKKIEFWKNIELGNNNFYVTFTGPYKLPVKVLYQIEGSNSYIDASVSGELVEQLFYHISVGGEECTSTDRFDGRDINSGNIIGEGYNYHLDPSLPYQISMNLPSRTYITALDLYYSPIDLDQSWANIYEECTSSDINKNYSSIFMGSSSKKEEVSSDKVKVINGESVTNLEITNSFDRNGAMVYVINLSKLQSTFYINSYYDVNLSDYTFNRSSNSGLTVTLVNQDEFNGFGVTVLNKELEQLFYLEYWKDRNTDEVKWEYSISDLGRSTINGIELVDNYHPNTKNRTIDVNVRTKNSTTGTFMYFSGIGENDNEVFTYISGGDAEPYSEVLDLYLNIEAINKENNDN